MNDVLILGGSALIIIGCYLLSPALALIVLGALSVTTGVIRMRGNRVVD